VCVDAALWALETDLLVIFEQEPLIPVQNYRHRRSLLFDAKSTSYVSMHHAAYVASSR
jgi:hypothetical protein